MQELLNFGEAGKGYILQAKKGQWLSVRSHVGTTQRGYMKFFRRDSQEGTSFEIEKDCVLVTSGHITKTIRWHMTNILYGATLARPRATVALGQYFLSARMAEFLSAENRPTIYVPESLAYMPIYEDAGIIALPTPKPTKRHTTGWVVRHELISQVLGSEPDLQLVRPFTLVSAVVR